MEIAKSAQKPLISTDTLTNYFKGVAAKIDKFKAISSIAKVEDDESLAICENNAAQLKTLINQLESLRKELGSPYDKTFKMINDYVKPIKVQLESFKDKIALEITNYKMIQEAAAKAKLNAQKLELEKIENEKKIEAEKLVRLTRTVGAKLYGGTFISKGEEKLANGCTDIADCDKLLEVLRESFPPEDQFKYFPDRRNELYRLSTKLIREHKINLMAIEGGNAVERKKALERINKAKTEAGISVQESAKSLDNTIYKESRKELKITEKEIGDATKGTRKIINFRIDNPSAVSREFLTVDEPAIRKWMEGKSVQIKNSLTKNEQPLSGIEFFIEEIYVAR